MPTRNINLTTHLNGFIDAGVRSGRFSNASEVVREGLRLLEQREAEDQARLGWLRLTTEQAFAALDRGEGIPITSPEQVEALISEAFGQAARLAR